MLSARSLPPLRAIREALKSQILVWNRLPHRNQIPRHQKGPCQKLHWLLRQQNQAASLGRLALPDWLVLRLGRQGGRQCPTPPPAAGPKRDRVPLLISRPIPTEPALRGGKSMRFPHGVVHGQTDQPLRRRTGVSLWQWHKPQRITGERLPLQKPSAPPPSSVGCHC